jgi:hypothetical protein
LTYRQLDNLPFGLFLFSSSNFSIEMFLQGMYAVCILLQVIWAIESISKSASASSATKGTINSPHIQPASPISVNLSHAGLFRADLTSANLEVAASNSHPRTSYTGSSSGQFDHSPASLLTETAPYPYQSYGERRDAPPSMTFYYNRSALIDQTPLLSRARVNPPSFADNAGPSEDVSIDGYHFDKGASDGLTAAKQLHHTGYHCRFLDNKSRYHPLYNSNYKC